MGHGEVTFKDCQTCGDFSPLGENVLVRFCHGLGDHVQFTAVLRHLAQRQKFAITLACHTRKIVTPAIDGMVHRIVEDGTEPPLKTFTRHRTLWFYEPLECYADVPSTKVERCLIGEFGVRPNWDLCGYAVSAGAERIDAARRLFGNSFALFHYRGRTSKALKDLDEITANETVRAIRAAGLRPLVLDLTGESQVRCEKIGPASPIWEFGLDVHTLTAIASASQLNVGIDSGPGKVFAAVPTPSLIVWRRLHPIHYHGPSASLHLVPADHESYIAARNRNFGLSVFRSRYRHRIGSRHLSVELPRAVRDLLRGDA